MTDRAALAREAMRTAFQVRRTLSIARDLPLNAFDTAQALGVEVRFVDASSLEGMFSRVPHPIILLPSLTHRPRGRVAFTCGHELGHFQLGHGSRIDELRADGVPTRGDEELAADVFASSLLMPRPAVLSCFRRRSIEPVSASPLVLFAVACELGVGYTTLLNHLLWGLQMVDDAWFRDRCRTTPKAIRSQIAGTHNARAMALFDGANAELEDVRRAGLPGAVEADGADDDGIALPVVAEEDEPPEQAGMA